MATQNHEEAKPDGAAFDDFFDSIGKRAENLTINDKKEAATNGDAAVDNYADDEQKVVDEIESLCMNCHENVSRCMYYFTRTISNSKPGNYAPPPDTNTFLPRDYHNVLLLSTLQLQERRNPICWRNSAERIQIRA